MNKEWSETNKLMQKKLRRKESFEDSVLTLMTLRDDLWNTALSFKESLEETQFHLMPFPNVTGYHNKTIAYSLWHIFRIEDCVVNTLMRGTPQVLLSTSHLSNIGTSLITTGNELSGNELVTFSQTLNVDALYEYCSDVKKSTDNYLKSLTFNDMKRKITQENKKWLETLSVVSSHEKASWLKRLLVFKRF